VGVNLLAERGDTGNRGRGNHLWFIGMTFNKYSSGNRLSARDLNKWTSEAERLGKLAVQPPLTLVEGTWGKALNYNRPTFPAVIVGTSSATGSAGANTAYSFAEVCAGAHGAYAIVGGGKAGATLYQVNDDPLTVGQIVTVFAGVDGEWGTTDGPGGITNPCATVVTIMSNTCFDHSLGLEVNTYLDICFPSGQVVASRTEYSSCLRCMTGPIGQEQVVRMPQIVYFTMSNLVNNPGPLAGCPALWAHLNSMIGIPYPCYFDTYTNEMDITYELWVGYSDEFTGYDPSMSPKWRFQFYISRAARNADGVLDPCGLSHNLALQVYNPQFCPPSGPTPLPEWENEWINVCTQIVGQDITITQISPVIGTFTGMFVDMSGCGNCWSNQAHGCGATPPARVDVTISENP
jgi:hypothetical protein